MSAKIVIDGVFFQIGRSGIARVWLKLLQHWVDQGFADQVVVIDRNRTCPRVDGIAYRDAPAFMYNNDQADRQALQTICDEEGARLFISSYYTFPLTTPSAMLVYDMIPEVLGWNLQEPMWQQKQRAMQLATHFAAISENSAKDVRIHLGRPDLPVRVAYTGSDFQPATPEAIDSFKTRHGLQRPYFLISGSRSSYKNVSLFFKAFAALGDERAHYGIVCTGGGQLEPEFAALAGQADVRVLILDDGEMQAAYSGAISLVYPSLYEGFGLPVLEAMACDCPAITSRVSSMPEVGGEAVLYIDIKDRTEEQMVGQLATHLRTVQNPASRQALIEAGRVQATHFRWDRMAEIMREFLVGAAEASPAPTASTETACRLCGGTTQWLFNKRVLHKYDVQFRQCSRCAATQTEKPYWLDEAYMPENEKFDTGQVTRSLINAAVINSLVPMAGLGANARVLDYGCGSGLMVRTLRDTGVDAWGYDRYSSPRLALGFQTQTFSGFDVVNLCEVVERFDEPRQHFDALFASNPSLVLIQTVIAPQVTESWDYITPEHGQHIFFLAPATVNWLCQTYGRQPVAVAGFQVLVRPDVAERLIDPVTGGLRAEHQQALQNLLPNLWMGLFSRPYVHASNDNQLLRQMDNASAVRG
ncbi:glycosyltransferase [Aquabacterium soli]|uniref:Glycosyltransferase n=1 Tax=Aquabacterium soli TaxID=2493092 RepID=A0A3R8RZI9_9BURK|nr:glycosyltransferase [Aquabacterium soli]RRS00013.1 glycosyltransferase [Aquabacterium soli]